MANLLQLRDYVRWDVNYSELVPAEGLNFVTDGPVRSCRETAASTEIEALNGLDETSLGDLGYVINKRASAILPLHYQESQPAVRKKHMLSYEEIRSSQANHLLNLSSHDFSRAAELMLDGAAAHLIRERESVDELFSRERLLPP